MSIYIIAEAGVNHNGDMALAKKMIEAAAEAGADAIKFQTFKTESLVTKTAPKAEYQLLSTSVDENQYEMLKKLELTMDDFCQLQAYAASCQIDFLSTPFDNDSVDLLADICKINSIKIASGELTNAPLLLKIAATDLPVILSTGMSNIGEIEIALGILAFGYLQQHNVKPCREAFQDAYASAEGQKVLAEKVTLLHCTTAYPTPLNEVNLACMDTLYQVFELPIGYSDHTQGIAVSLAAAARGACIIEKHFTLDKALPGPDQKASLMPQEFMDMVNGIRQIEQAIGSHRKITSKTERKNILIARKSLVAAKNIKKGELFTEDNLTVKRPAGGIEPLQYWNYIGQSAGRDYYEDEQI